SSGKMRDQAGSLNEAAKRNIAEVVTQGKLNLAQAGDAKRMQNACTSNPAFSVAANQPAWNGWGAGVTNTRFQNASNTLAARDVAKLKLKGSLGFAGVAQV